MRVLLLADPQLQAGPALMAVAVVGRRQERIGDADRLAPLHDGRPPGLLVVAARAGRTQARQHDPAFAGAEPRRHGAHQLEPRPIHDAPGVAALADGLDRPPGAAAADAAADGDELLVARHPAETGDRLVAGDLGGSADGLQFELEALLRAVPGDRPALERRLDGRAQAAQRQGAPVGTRRRPGAAPGERAPPPPAP